MCPRLKKNVIVPASCAGSTFASDYPSIPSSPARKSHVSSAFGDYVCYCLPRYPTHAAKVLDTNLEAANNAHSSEAPSGPLFSRASGKSAETSGTFAAELPMGTGILRDCSRQQQFKTLHSPLIGSSAELGGAEASAGSPVALPRRITIIMSLGISSRR